MQRCKSPRACLDTAHDYATLGLAESAQFAYTAFTGTAPGDTPTRPLTDPAHEWRLARQSGWSAVYQTPPAIPAGIGGPPGTVRE